LARDKNFILFWLARTISLFGTSITAVVLPILVFKVTGSALDTSLIAALDGLPYIIFGIVAGAVADRHNRRRLMVVSDVVNAGLMASIPAVYYLHHLPLSYIYIVAGGSATAFVWFDAANFGAVRALAGADRVVVATTTLMATETVVAIGGLAIGGLLAATIGPVRAIIFDASSYLLSAILIAIIRAPFKESSLQSSMPGAPWKQLFSDVSAGLRYIWNSRIIRLLTAATIGVTVAGGAVGGLTVVYAVDALGLSKTDPRIGLLYACGAIGSFLSSIAIPRLQKHFNAGRITVIGLFLNCILLIALARAPSFAVAIVIYMFWEASYTVVTLNGITIRTRITPDLLQGRVNAAARTVAWGGAPIGAAIGGVLTLRLEIRSVILVMCLAIFASLVLCVALKVWSLKVTITEA
jgi:MFS family permease